MTEHDTDETIEQSDGDLSNGESIEETDLLSAGGGSSEYESGEDDE